MRSSILFGAAAVAALTLAGCEKPGGSAEQTNKPVNVAQAGRRRPQNSAQLRQEHVRVGQAPADRTQTQRRIQVGVVAD